jgi:O-acetyl-ADP-ribose deacetylase (regulator of RNase III)
MADGIAMLSFRIPPATLEIVDGDITLQDVDAIVNAANNHFWMGSGVAGALKARGGPAIETEAMALGPVEPGDAVVTGGGQLRARHVIHAAVMGQDLQTSTDIIERATGRVLELSEYRQFRSIALPAFGTGVGGFSIRACALIMIDVIRAHRARSLRVVRLVLFGQHAYLAFAEVAGERLGPPLDGPPDCPISA